MKNNTNHLARLRVQERDQTADFKRVYDEGIENMKQEVIAQRESVLQAFITEEVGSNIINPEEIARRGQLKPYPDGVEEFLWDDHPRIRFLPVGFMNDNGTRRLVQQFERIPAPKEESCPYYKEDGCSDCVEEPHH